MASNSVFPSTSNPALRSTSAANVAIPTTFNVSLILVISNSVLPSTSKLALASISEVNVDMPVTSKPEENVNIQQHLNLY